MIEKQESYTQIELLESGEVQLRKTTKIIEDGNVISQSHHRSIVVPTDDISAYPQNIQDVCNAFWTEEIIQSFIDKQQTVI